MTFLRVVFGNGDNEGRAYTSCHGENDEKRKVKLKIFYYTSVKKILVY